SSSPGLVFVRNTLDGPALYDAVSDAVLASIGVLTGSGRTAEQRTKVGEENFREKMGFGLREDLAPAIGPEVFVSLERVAFDPLQTLPTIEIIVGVGVRDRERMGKVVAGFEKFLAQQMDSTRSDRGEISRAVQPDRPGTTAASAPALRSLQHRSKTIKSFTVPRAPQYSLCYALTDDFVIIGLGADSVRRALDRAAVRSSASRAEPQTSFHDGPLFARVRPLLGEQANEILFLNVPKLTAVGRDIAGRIVKGNPSLAAEAKRAESLLALMRSVAAVGVNAAGRDFGLHTRGVLLFATTSAKPVAKPAQRK
ncbi:hypothetical protein FJY63_02095, partial [Candidatus Sumerlaeota bacterium]|nr:hypothetical protein [Candidatus Sumerlaeota bacterium]